MSGLAQKGERSGSGTFVFAHLWSVRIEPQSLAFLSRFLLRALTALEPIDLLLLFQDHAFAL
jgi:hypothetical protein